ncbi:MAG TPA: YajG family lipoprotein [Rhizomicrobium sp.]|nr:YajG family lipoprotein [Rhizomicrobium sp.]
MKKEIGAAAAAALMLVMLGGCATQEDIVPVPYAAVGGSQIGNGTPVAVVVEDARTEDRTRISNKINGYGMEMAAIRANRAISDIVRDAMEAELRSRGFAIGAGGPSAKLAVNRFYASFKQNLFSGDAVSEVKLHVVVVSPSGQTQYERQVDVEGVAAKIMIASGSNAATALSDGMTKAFRTLFDDPAFVAALTKSGATASVSARPNS